MEDFGSGELRQGVAVVTIDAAFAETVTAKSRLKLAPGAHPRVMAPHPMNHPHQPEARPVSATATRP